MLSTPPPIVAPAPESVLSGRAKRRLAYLLRLHLLELREAGLDRARAVIERRLSVDRLLEDGDPLPHYGGKPTPKR